MRIQKTLLALYENHMNKKSAKHNSDQRAAALKRYSILSIILVILFVILINVFVDVLTRDGLQIDMSTENMNSLSIETRELLDQLEHEVEIIGLFDEPQNLEGSIYSYFVPLINEYTYYSNGQVSVRYVDPISNPSIIDDIDPSGLNQFQPGQYVIRIDDQFRVINPYDCFVFDPYFLEMGMYSPLFNNVETVFTGSIYQLTSRDMKNAYYLLGQGQSNKESLEILLNYSGFSLEELYLPVKETVPEDCDILFINLPKNDISSEDKDAILAYLMRGGKVVIAYSHFSYYATFENLNALIMEMNMYFDDYIVHEQNPAHLFNVNTPHIFRSRVHEDFEFLSNDTYLMTGNCRGLFELDNPDPQIVVNTLLHTSPDAILKFISDEHTDTTSAGVQNIIMHSVNNRFSQPGQMLVISSDYFTSNEYLSYAGVNDPNAIFVKRSLEYMFDEQMSELVEAKSFPNYMLTNLATINQQTFWTIILMAVVPFIFVVVSVVVYVKRKNK